MNNKQLSRNVDTEMQLLHGLETNYIPSSDNKPVETKLAEKTPDEIYTIVCESHEQARKNLLTHVTDLQKPDTDQNQPLNVINQLNALASVQEIKSLGNVQVRKDIKSNIKEFLYMPNYKVHYPPEIISALSSLYAEYNNSFRNLVEKNREWNTDYQYCTSGENNIPINFCVQIDMRGLPQSFLETAHTYSPKTIKEVLRKNIFEIENSIAMYQLLTELSAADGQKAAFKMRFRQILECLRQKNNKPIALLAVTQQKYEAMRQSEFGKINSEPLLNEEIKELSGFDTMFGPDDFCKHLEENDWHSKYLLYVRSSDPIDKLKKPGTIVDHPLLKNSKIRQVIKANSLTLNIDSPEMSFDKKINDTKEYMPIMGMGYQINNFEDLQSESFKDYMRSCGKNPGQDIVHAKPSKLSYGCYGHLNSHDPKKFRNELKKNLKERGSYIVQPDMPAPTMINSLDGQNYMYIDRNWFASDGTNYGFVGGYRTLMPIDSIEAKKGRVHGSKDTVWAEIHD